MGVAICPSCRTVVRVEVLQRPNYLLIPGTQRYLVNGSSSYYPLPFMHRNLLGTVAGKGWGNGPQCLAQGSSPWLGGIDWLHAQTQAPGTEIFLIPTLIKFPALRMLSILTQSRRADI